MMDPLALSVIALWVVVVALGICVLALSRQIGILYERVAPMGALMMDHGPKVGELAPPVEVTTWEGQGLTIGTATAKSTLLFFVSPTCPVCKKLLPIIRSVQSRENRWLNVILASDGDRPEHATFRDKHQLGDFPYVLSQPLGMAYKISKLPYCVLLDANGFVRAKGLVNSREQVESLMTAYESGIASVQEHIDRQLLAAEAHPEKA
ncbi:methylamine dehydrogenase accessory protein MauD [Dechloromonas sp. XY25]|uniref:Methylamine utilization protein MauD n=1 Tax=Dechloromonas hankyongensis TaxID=2908002 RepID=A0ABS9K7I8_9RHOO|nr:methylamine dehydrogenase accessory protein MauD [Dechloromonas hankyongensis]MCG2579133.1 methylamine dehydrogenase accessory protein MauD [Dechloromonas hankyongensis]